MKYIVLILILMLVTNQQASLMSNIGKPNYTLRVERVSEIKHSKQSDYNINMSINPMYGLPQVWFW